MIAHPLPAVSTACAGENVKTNLRPAIHSLSNLNRFVLRMVRWIDSLRSELRAGRRITTLHGKVAVQFQHRGFWRDGIRAVDLDLIVVLRLGESGVTKTKDHENQEHTTLGNPFLLNQECGPSRTTG